MQSNEPLTNSSLSHGGDDCKQDDDLGDFAGQSFEDRNGQHHPIAEFLYQLTKLLTDDNSEIIEWADGRIKVHHPERLEGEVLHKYFRHSKFASFQRQLNYFGFRKIAGKGKMSPCSYVNEAATSDIRSLLLIKRKTNGTAARKAALQQRAAALVSSAGLNPALATMNFAALAGDQNAMAMLNGQALSNAMALLSENALRASVGQMPIQQQATNQLAATQQLANQQLTNQQLNLLALQQQHQRLQKQLQEQQQQQQQQTQLQLNQFGTDQIFQNKLMGLQSFQQPDESSNQNLTSSTPSLEQLQAHLAALSQQQQQQQQQQLQQQQQQQNNALNQNLLNRNLASLPAAFLTSGGNATGALNSLNVAAAALNPASAALNRATAAFNAQQQASNNAAMPATAAMDAASATAQMNNNLFESAANLKSLLNEHQQQQNDQAQHTVANQSSLFNRFPSSGAMFPENASTVSFGNLLGSSNRLNSLLSLNSFLGSREASLADFAAAMPANVRDQLAAGAGGVAAAAAAAAQVRGDAAKFRANV